MSVSLESMWMREQLVLVIGCEIRWKLSLPSSFDTFDRVLYGICGSAVWLPAV